MRIALPFLPPQQCDPATKNFQSSILVKCSSKSVYCTQPSSQTASALPCSSRSYQIWGWAVAQRRCLNCLTVLMQVSTSDTKLTTRGYQHHFFAHASYMQHVRCTLYTSTEEVLADEITSYMWHSLNCLFGSTGRNGSLL